MTGLHDSFYFDFPKVVSLVDASDQHKSYFLNLWESSRHIIVTNSPSAQDFNDALDSTQSSYTMPFKTIFLETLVVLQTKTKPDGEVMLVRGFLANERSPGDMEIIFIGADQNYSPVIYSVNDQSWAQKIFLTILDQINSQDCCIGSTKVSGGLKNRLGEKQREVKRIVICAPKKERESATKILNREIDWSHKWEVRGHWRKGPLVGKDREGNYSVNGFTWVREHEKGKGELVIKSRLFKTNENGDDNDHRTRE